MRLALSKGLNDPIEQEFSSFHLTTETDTVSEMSCSGFLILDDEQNPEPQ
jgi:hypothetical protein